MQKKRRKLNKDFEKKIYSSKKNVELVFAKIFYIYDEDIKKEYIYKQQYLLCIVLVVFEYIFNNRSI